MCGLGLVLFSKIKNFSSDLSVKSITIIELNVCPERDHSDKLFYVDSNNMTVLLS